MTHDLPAFSPDPGLRADAGGDTVRLAAQAQRLTVPADFTVGVAGDIIATAPFLTAGARIAGFDALRRVIAGIDAMTGNLELPLCDLHTTPGDPFGPAPNHWATNGCLRGPVTLARELASLGFHGLGRANNHTIDYGIAGLLQTTRALDAAGLAHAGAGVSAATAIAPAYLEGPRARVALVSVATWFLEPMAASDPRGLLPPRPGLAGLRTQTLTTLPPPAFAQLRAILADRGLHPDAEGHLALNGAVFVEGAAHGYRHRVHPNDWARLLSTLRDAAQRANLVVLNIHSHEVPDDTLPESPAPFLAAMAPALIAAGADVIAVSGHHHVGPVTVIDGRPVFLGLGNLFWMLAGEHLPPDSRDDWEFMGKAEAAFDHPERATDLDITAAYGLDTVSHRRVWQGVLPVSRFGPGRLEAVTLYPLALGQEDPIPTAGVPRLAPSAEARQILERIAELSAAHGTEIQIDDQGDSVIAQVHIPGP